MRDDGRIAGYAGAEIYAMACSNVNDGLEQVLKELNQNGREEDSRNGKVLTFNRPVAVTYMHPLNNIMLSPLRDANPFFHVYEALWMLAGRNDVEPLKRYAANLGLYSDDGKTLHGAYGYRWRRYFGDDRSEGLVLDQLLELIEHLKKTPNSRRAVLAMWDASDISSADAGKDVPCNTHAYFRIIGSKEAGVRQRLDMTVCNRSNDVIWGMMGANAVHFSFLLQFMAEAIGVEVGRYTQFANNAHIYLEREDVKKLYFNGEVRYTDVNVEREESRVYHRLLAKGIEPSDWLKTVEKYLIWIDEPGQRPFEWGQFSPFVEQVAHPMLYAHALYKANDMGGAVEWCYRIKDPVWRKVSLEWILRRVENRIKKEDHDVSQ